MAFNPKQTVLNYFKKKKPLSIFFDATFVIVIALLLIPATRKETAAFFIRLTSFPASTLDSEEQFKVSSSVARPFGNPTRPARRGAAELRH